MPGPKPESPEVKKFKQTSRRPVREESTGRPEPERYVGQPTAPKGRGKYFAEEWRRIAKESAALGLMRKMDKGVYVVHCELFELLCNAADHVRDKGAVLIEYYRQTNEEKAAGKEPRIKRFSKNPNGSILLDAIGRYQASCKMLGIGPHPRTQLPDMSQQELFDKPEQKSQAELAAERRARQAAQRAKAAGLTALQGGKQNPKQ